MPGLTRSSPGLPSFRPPGSPPALQRAGSAVRGVLGFRWSRWLRRLAWYRAVVATFLVCVLLPTLATFAYYAFMAAPQYQSTVRLAVYAIGGDERRSLEMLSGATAGISGKAKTKPGKDKDELETTSLQHIGEEGNLLRRILRNLTSTRSTSGDGKDPFLVVQYITSRAIVSEINKDGWLAALFRREDIDAVSRLPSDAAREDIWRYFNHRVEANIDEASRLVTIQVRTFSPEDSAELARRIVQASEKLVNDIRTRRINDTIARADEELRNTEGRYLRALAAVRALRDEIGVINPREGVTALAKALLELKVVKIALETEYQTKDAMMGPDSPVRRTLLARIAATDAEIADLEGQLTGDPERGKVVASYLVDFENRETERMLAQLQYQQAITTFDRAQADARRQGVYLAVFSPPSAAEEARYPRTWSIVLTVFIVVGALWSIGCMVLAGVRDQLT